MKSDLDILQLTDKEKIAFLEKRHESIIKWIERERQRAIDAIKPLPSPMDFQMSTEEEQEQTTRAIMESNWHHDSVEGAYSYLLTAIEVGDKQMIAKLYKEKFPSNEYEI